MQSYPGSAFVASACALALLAVPLAGSAQLSVPRGAVTPAGAPGGFANSPTTTNAQGGQESVTVDDKGKLRAVGRSRVDQRPGVTMQRRNMATRTPKGTVVHGTYVAPRATLPPHP